MKHNYHKFSYIVITCIGWMVLSSSSANDTISFSQNQNVTGHIYNLAEVKTDKDKSSVNESLKEKGIEKSPKPFIKYIASYQEIVSKNPPPKFHAFNNRLLKYAKKLGVFITTEKNSTKRRKAVYYDAARSFYQIAKFTGKKEPWYTYARAASDIYVNDYLSINGYKPAGWWIFPHGLEMDWRLTGNTNSLTSLFSLYKNLPSPGFHPKTDRWVQQMYSRPVAYTLETNMAAEREGKKRNTVSVNLLVNMALGHIRQWTTGVYLDTVPQNQHVQAFMAGLTASALIDYYERSIELGMPDKRIPIAIKKIADWLWINMWVDDVGGTPGSWNDLGGTGYGTFRFRHAKVKANNNPAPIVAQLIVPMYAFVYKFNCDSGYRAKADLIFSGSVGLAKNLTKGKFFNQQHRNVFDYFSFRLEGDKHCK